MATKSKAKKTTQKASNKTRHVETTSWTRVEAAQRMELGGKTPGRTKGGKELAREAQRDGLRCERVHGYDVYFEGDNKEGWSCFAPTLLGCVSAGDSVTECKRNMAEAIELHLEGMQEDGEEIPERDWRGAPRPAAQRGRTVSISSRVSPKTAKVLEKISRKKKISKTEAIEQAIQYFAEHEV